MNYTVMSRSPFRSNHPLRVLWPLSVVAAGGCVSEQIPAEQTGRLNLAVAPLSLPEVTNAEYKLSVYEGPGLSSLVWSESDLSADQYGDGAGSLTFVGTCVDNNAAGPTTNTVVLVLEDLYAGTPPTTVSTADYVNPCPLSAPCTLEAACEENTDVAVTFNLTIMRDAKQGFFDVAVNFSDVFCSAKVDCPQTLLFNDANVRGPTAVLAFACTAGDTGPTYLYLDDITFAGVTYNVNAPTGNNDAVPGPGGKYAIYKDREDLPGYTKYFWNVAIDVTGKSGKLVTTGTASDKPLVGNTTPVATKYPIINFGVDIGLAGAGTCPANPLDGTLPGGASSGVKTSYTLLSATRTFAHSYGGGAGEVSPPLPGGMSSSRVVFSSFVAGDWDLYSVDSDGANLKKVFGHTGQDKQPRLSPNGQKIAFTGTSGGSQDIFVVGVDGNGLVQLTGLNPDSNASTQQWPSWSPDGTKIAFSGTFGAMSGSEIYVMNANGTNVQQLTGNSTPTNSSQPSWSPVGNKIAFRTDRDGNGEIYVMNDDGSSQTRLTNNLQPDSVPVWSPDGTRLAFVRPSTSGAGQLELYVIDANGSNETRLTNDSYYDETPAWSPDGTKLVFISDRSGGGWRLHVMSLPGGAITAWSKFGDYDADPHWR